MKLYGGAELARKLQALSAKASRRVLVDVLTTAAEPIRDRAAALAPRGDPKAPNLGDSIGIGVGRGGDEHTARVFVGPTKDAYYGFYQEFGTSRHAARPFLRPAFDGEVERAVTTIGDELGRVLTENSE